ncbi:MAG TPA: hypothetical protein VN238_18130 [Solirubrobacteraceae bacterium]|nr:hypothetical protein [Solirubrobacteraceae bacterium]
MSEQEPRLGHPLPNARDAVIDAEKLRDYALDPDHPRGRHKAILFRRALGIEMDDLEYLRQAILAELPFWPVTDVRVPVSEEGQTTWEVFLPVRGLGRHARRTLKVLTAWAIVDGRPELKTTRVGRPKEQ